MGVVVLDGSTVRNFVEDEDEFNKTVDHRFALLDVNSDGVLSRSELRKAFESLRLLESHFGMEVQSTPEQLNELYNSVFDRFDTDHNNKVDLNEFRSEMKKIMLAIADGLGVSPIQLVLEEDSLLKEAVDFSMSSSSGSVTVSLTNFGQVLSDCLFGYSLFPHGAFLYSRNVLLVQCKLRLDLHEFIEVELQWWLSGWCFSSFGLLPSIDDGVLIPVGSNFVPFAILVIGSPLNRASNRTFLLDEHVANDVGVTSQWSIVDDPTPLRGWRHRHTSRSHLKEVMSWSNEVVDVSHMDQG
eukprot:Gb_13659 [translate_table: standard]